MRYFFFFFFLVNCSYSQSIIVDNTNFTPLQLTNLLLGSSCVSPSNVAFSSSESVAYFNQNGSAFPMQEGVIIRNGNASFTAGTYTNSNLSSQINSNSDTFLQTLANQSGQNLQVTDVAFLSFDFTSISSSFSFDFIFASNEYGEWQCGFSDVFAFVLTDLTTNISQNLAIVPGTSSPVSVLTIRDQAYNSSCNSVNPSFFEVFNVNDPSSSVMNMRGFTKLMTANAQIIPNRTYNIKLVIGDVIDSDFDSAIFLSSGSFQNNIDLGENLIYCDGTSMFIESGLDDTTYVHEWYINDEIVINNNTQTLPVTQPGLYQLLVSLPDSDCMLEGSVTVAPLGYQSPIPITVCVNSGEIPIFDLSINSSEQLGINNTGFVPVYFASEEDFNNNEPILNFQNYNGFNGQSIYIGLLHEQSQTFCSQPLIFQLNVLDVLVLDNPSPIIVCFNETFNFNLVQQIPLFLNNIDPNLVEVSFYISEPIQGSDVGLIVNPESFSLQNGVSQQTIWIQVAYLINDACTVYLPFQLEVVGLPEVPVLENVIVCESFELPVLSNGSYYTQSGGNGIQYQPGDIVDFSTVLYIFSGGDNNGCTNESSFQVTILQDYDLDEEYCGSFTIPDVDSATFYTQSGGPDGNGQILPIGTTLTESQTIYFYAVVEDVFCVEYEFNIIIRPLPPVDTLTDVVVCDSYILPPLVHGQYRTASGGGGVVLNPGQPLFNTRQIFIYAENEYCTNESSFVVSILRNYENVLRCGSFTLPNPPIGSFFTAPSGQGQQIPNGSQIFETTLIYYFAETTVQPNCTNDFSFLVTIVGNPVIPTPEDITICINQSPYILPTLTNGQYFTGPNRSGIQLLPGQSITETTTIYINAVQSQFGLDCQSEHAFTVFIRPLPPVEIFSDIYSCSDYILPSLVHGTYYSGPNATGNVIESGTVINQEQTLYIFNEWDDVQGCANESVFTVFPLGLVLPDFQDISVCDSYVLPSLTIGNYFTEPGGGGTLLPSGLVLTESQTIYVYVFDGNRIICENEKSFQINITSTPVLPDFPNLQSCESIQLPDLNSSEYQVFYSLDASGENPLSGSETLIDIPGVYTVFVFVSSIDNATCQVQGQFQVEIFPPRTLSLEDGYICVDPLSNRVLQAYTIQSGLNPQLFNVEWYLNGNFLGVAPNWIASTPGVYMARPIMLTPENPPLCAYQDAFVNVSLSSIPSAEIIVTNDFSNNSDVIVQILSGYGQYEFQLDEGSFQTSPIFQNVDTGFHTITIKDAFGNCGQITLEAVVINYPNFFTPNGDGTNDYWMIKNLVFFPGAKIVIFDRYGKILTQLNHNSVGWNGDYNGQPMPSSDYWFVVYYLRNNEPREFKAHFSMKR
jgi:gliding motility-associated-like protein